MAEMLIMEFVMGFADNYERARQDAVRRLHGHGRQQGPPGFPG